MNNGLFRFPVGPAAKDPVAPFRHSDPRDGQKGYITTPWYLALDYSGRSFAPFTNDGSAAFSSDGSMITGNAGTNYWRARTTARAPIVGAAVLEAEFYAVSITGTNLVMSLFTGWDGAGSGAPVAQLSSAGTPTSDGAFRLEEDAVGARVTITDSTTRWTTGRWYRIRAVSCGERLSGFLARDDEHGAMTFMATAGNLLGDNDSSYVGFGCQGGEFRVRNFKLWRLALPGEVPTVLDTVTSP
jgi:hypothetical protein